MSFRAGLFGINSGLAPPAWVLPLPSSATFAQGSLPSAGASLTARGALPAGPGLQNFWDQLAAVEQLSTAGPARLLHLGNNAHFPLEGSDVRGRLLVRQCYAELSQILQDYLAAQGRSFIITGNSGMILGTGIPTQNRMLVAILSG